jgi:hypothetical protein
MPDIIMDPIQMIEALKTLEKFDCVIPTSSLVKLTHPESTIDIKSIISNGHKPGFKSNMTDGISIFKRE